VRHTLKKSEIIRGKRIFDQIFERGVRVRSAIIQALVLVSPADDGSPPAVRMAAVVPKVAGKATVRNRLKRLIRESYRHEKSILLSPGRQTGATLNVVFLWSPRTRVPAREITLATVRNEITGLLHKIKEQFT
jgi:ribonuclease P protein component